MSSVSPPNKSDTNRVAVDSDNEQSGGGTEGTGDRLNEAAKRFVELGDAGPIFMACESGGERGPMVVLKCTDLSHAQSVHRAIIDIVHAVRQF